MQVEIENGNLVILADDLDRADLREIQADDPEAFGADKAMYEYLEWITCNTGYEWINPEEIGALTDAPILGLTDKAGNVTEAYGYMDYQVKSPLDDLLETGRVVFVSGN